MKMNDAFTYAFTVKPRKACRRKAWPGRMELRGATPKSGVSYSVSVYLLLSSEVAYNKENTLAIKYSPTTEDMMADDWEVA